jgi:signal transduction histidine kinase
VVARATRTITIQISFAAVAIVILIVAVSVTFVIKQSQPSELLEKPAPGQTKIYVDANDVFLALAVTGAIATVFAGLLSWVIARRAVAPLGQALRIQRSFVADASHELRTPVAILGMRVEVLEQEITRKNDPSTHLAELRQDVHALGEIITDLLLAASPAEHETNVACLVPDVLEDALRDMRILADRTGVRLAVDGEEGLTAALPAATLRRCIIVLVDNAITHSPQGGTVEVQTRPARHGMFELQVTDHGDGLVGIDSDRIFDRFAHGPSDDDPVRRTGFGIGLSLLRDIAERYGGRVGVGQARPGSTTFTLTLPLRQP